MAINNSSVKNVSSWSALRPPVNAGCYINKTTRSYLTNGFLETLKEGQKFFVITTLVYLNIPYSLEFENKKKGSTCLKSYWRVTKVTFTLYRITFPGGGGRGNFLKEANGDALLDELTFSRPD